ncbi:MAG: ribose 5-phosphate isomerase B [Candidatus Omnitrophica bacterium]|nr:ribose 5-phosphate isomerase B [Candidatus Omnitrophota bacterium]
MKERILIASDHAGFSLKEELKKYLQNLSFDVKDLGTYSEERCDYPDFAYNLASLIFQRKYKRGILICKTGIGNSIVANRFPGVRAGLCYNIKSARLSREHNDTNVLVLGAEFVSKDYAKKILKTWLNTKFLKGRHRRRLNKIKKIEEEILKKLCYNI